MAAASLLIVDDDVELLKALARVLEKHGYHVVARPDAISALEMIECDKEKFDVVITDVSMPGMKGTSFLAKVKNARPGLPVILVTAFGDWADYQCALQEGAFDYLSKPLNKDDLLAAVRHALDRPDQYKRPTPPWDGW